MNSTRYLPVVLLLGMIGLFPLPASSGETMKSKSLPPIPLSVDEIHAWIDRAHPLLRGAGTEKVMARGKMLKALGAFEPTLINDTELERFISISDPGMNFFYTQGNRGKRFRFHRLSRRGGEGTQPDHSQKENDREVATGIHGAHSFRQKDERLL